MARAAARFDRRAARDSCAAARGELLTANGCWRGSEPDAATLWVGEARLSSNPQKRSETAESSSTAVPAWVANLATASSAVMGGTSRRTHDETIAGESLGSVRKPGSRNPIGTSVSNLANGRDGLRGARAGLGGGRRGAHHEARFMMWSAGQSNGSVMPNAPPTRQCFISFQMLSQ